MNIDEARWPLDELAKDLATLRHDAGDMSFADIAAHITHNREQAGMPARLAAVSRSTVYHAFQTGRTRINARLVSEIVMVLTGDQELAKQWLARCVAAQQPRSNPVTNSVAPAHVADLVNPGEQLVSTSEIEHPSPKKSSVLPPPKLRIPALVALGVLVNVAIFLALHLPFPDTFPLFTDMVGVAIVAIVAGPWWGALTALFSAATITALSPITGIGTHTLFFSPVAIIGALVWGYGIQRLKFGDNLARFLFLNVLVGVVCTAVAYLVVGIVFGGAPMMNTVAQMATSLIGHGLPTNIAVLISNLIISIIDKLVVGIIALMITGSVLQKFAPSTIAALISSRSIRDGVHRFRIHRLVTYLTRRIGAKYATIFGS